MLRKMSKRAISLFLSAVIASSMFTCCKFLLSAEDPADDTVSVYERFTWSPMRGVTATQGVTVKDTNTTENVPIADAKASTINSIENVLNEDGTVTCYQVTKATTVTANTDGETATVTTTVTKVPYVFENPAFENGKYFKFGIYSDRDNNTRGYHYATVLTPRQIYSKTKYGNSFSSANNVTLNNQHVITLAETVQNVIGSYYLIMNQEALMKDTVIFRVQQYNEMALTFVAPEDGVYSASGIISMVKTSGNADENNAVQFYLAKIDKNGIEHMMSETANVPLKTNAPADIPNVKIKLKAGEMLVLRTDNNKNYVGKVFVENYLITKWDYAEGKNKSNVTVNYGYQNHNFMNVYGESYALTDTNFDNKLLWDVEAIRLTPTTEKVDEIAVEAKADFNKLYDNAKTGGIKIVAQTTGFCRPGANLHYYGSSLRYEKTTGDIYASVARDFITTSTGPWYKFGTRFTFTVPEDGYVVLTGGTDVADTLNAYMKYRNKERYGIIKAGNDEIEYKTGWTAEYTSSSNRNLTYDIGELKAGDKIVLEIGNNHHQTSSAQYEYTTVNSLNVALTTENTAADINGDFKCDASDYAYIRKYLLEAFTAKDKTIFDVNGDNEADIRDLVAMKKADSGNTAE